jgi:sugar-specific transcriptional regulator TrmB
MSNLIKYLEQLELSEMEAKFYLKLFETGPISIVNLAQLLGMKRTTAYLYLDPLIDKGLVVRVVKGSKKLVAPTDPENLTTLINKKIAQTKKLEETFPDVLQEIKGIFPQLDDINDVDIKYLKGVHNARLLYEEAFRAKEVRAYARVDPSERLWPDNAKVFEEAFQKNKDLQWWEFVYDPASAVEVSDDVVSSTDRYKYRFMPKHLQLSSEDILIYDGKVAIINYRGGGTSVVLQSPDFYNNLKALFDFMWDILATPEK